MLIVAPWGAGANHVRVLLGLRPGGEIRNHDGRRLLDHEKLPWLSRVFYNRARCQDWLRMEWLTRQHYADSEICHDPGRQQLPQIRLWSPDPEPVVRLYEAKCPSRNGLTRAELWDRVAQVEPCVGAVNITSDSLFRANFCHTPQARHMALSTPDHDAVHQQWCGLNRELLSGSW